MQADRCMYLHLAESDNTALDLVLSAQEEDDSKEWPGKWAMFESKVVDDESQQWYFDSAKGTLSNAANPHYTLDTYQGWLFLANTKDHNRKKRKEFPCKTRKWFYDDKLSGLTTNVDGIPNMVALWGQPKQWEWAEVASVEQRKDKAASQLRIEYCYNP